MKLVGKSGGDEVTILMDPYDGRELGLRPLRCAADIVTISTPHAKELDTGGSAGEAFVIDAPGEYELKKIFFEGVAGFCDRQQGQEKGLTTFFKVIFEDMTLVHLGYAGASLTDTQLEQLEGCDVLFLPAGNKSFLTLSEATEVMTQLEPKIVIPILYKIPEISSDLYNDITGFSKEMGLESQEPVSKLRITHKDMAEEKTKIILLQKE